MKYRVYDCSKQKFLKVTGNKEDLLNKYSGRDVLVLPEISFKENDLTFDEWLKSIFDAESDMKHGINKAEDDLMELQESCPKFHNIYCESLENLVF